MSISETNEKIAIVGSGLIGSSWAIVFSRAGCAVTLFDAKPGVAAEARQRIAGSMAELEAAGLVGDAKTALSRIVVVDDLAAAVRNAVYVQENTLETLECKRAIFAELDAVLAPETIVGSSSSGIPTSSFTEPLRCRSRCLIAHPVNPPHLVPAVELVPAPWTSPKTRRWVRDFMTRVGQEPVEMTRELEGFILNRLQGALLMEAWDLVAEGYASVADVDRTVASGLGMRWSFMGPFETIDLNAPDGVADYAHRFGPLYRRIADSRRARHPWTPDLITEVERQRRAILPADRLRERATWRNHELMALARRKRESSSKA